MLLDTGVVSVTEAAEALDVNASTAHRLLVTLAQDGFAEQRTDRRYSLGPSLAYRGGADIIRPLGDRLHPALMRLSELVGETVHFATLLGVQVQNLDGIETTTHNLRFGLRVGVWLPAHTSASGKALLADFSREEVEARFDLAATGPRPQALDVDLEALHEQLDDVRDTRIAWNFEETEPGLVALAISTGDLGGQRAAISINAPIARFTKALGEHWSASLISVVDDLHHDRL